MPGDCMSTTGYEIPLGVGARQGAPPPGELGIARPHLLTLQHPAALGGDGPGRERRQIGAGSGLAEELAPDLLGAQDARDPARLLLVGAVGQNRRAAVI